MKARGPLSVVLGLTGLVASAAAPAVGGQIRTTTTLGGYTVFTESAPVRVLFDDPGVAIPRPPGTAIVEADPSYTMATLDTGPAARGLASSLWPGNLLGDGWSQVTAQVPIPGKPATYPIKADARYPDNPHVATGGDNGMFMNASALGLDVTATAQAVPTVPGGALDVGSVTSTSRATVDKGVAIGTSVSKVSDFSFMSGLIKVGSISTTLTTRSDGNKPTSSGSTVVSGLSIGGVGYVVDEKGARPVGTPVNQGSGPLPSGVLDPAKALGITVSGITQTTSKDSTSVNRTAQGLQIVLDTAPLRAALSPVTGPLQGPIGQVISKLPSALQGYAYMAVMTTPKITLVLGSGQASSDAALPITFPPFPSGGPQIGGPLPVPPSGGVSGPVTSVGGVVNLPTGPTPGPTVAATTTPLLHEAAVKDPFHGIPAALILLLLAVAFTAGVGLVRLRSAALAGENRSSLPDLRGA